ncbi:MAG: tyrosine-type recombinase/integrase [Nanoarchaeota archaeon]|nr:tyrosine-type recombinase/integrase [Nanoarchaeota archaeon]
MEIQEKRDPYNAKKSWEEWKKRNNIIEGINRDNSDLILRCLSDLEEGKNINKIKGNRSPIRLISLQCRLVFFAKIIRDKRLIDMTKDDLHKIFKDMGDGKMQKKNSKGENIGNYTSVDSYLKDFKVMWNWLLKTKQVQENITEDLGKADKKPPWVYLTEEQFKTLANRCSAEYRPLMWLMLDACCRVTEGYSIKVEDFSEDFKQLTIREETSKNKYGRTIHLKLCSSLIKEYVKFHNLNKEDFLFQKTPQAFNKYLKRFSISEGINSYIRIIG